MQQKALHIVSFDNPYPPVYGGAIEVFFKIKPLHDLGIHIHFHCFVDLIPEKNPELERITEKIYYYENDKNPFNFFSGLPFSVNKRNDKKLLQNLLSIEAPILFESLKTTFLVHKKRLNEQYKILRLHNIEHDYFEGISSSENSLLKKWIYKLEAWKYKKYESVITEFDQIITLSKFENAHIIEKIGKSNYIPVFHGNTKVKLLDGVGKYAIYHGDLRMSDNLRVVLMLIDIFREIYDFQLIIASNSRQDYISKKIEGLKNVAYVPIKNFEHLQQLLMDAQMNLIFSFQKSGTKLKLMNALYNSRFCIVNDNIMDDENVTQLCEFANTKEEIILKIREIQNQSYTDYEKRRNILETQMNDVTNARSLADKIFGLD